MSVQSVKGITGNPPLTVNSTKDLGTVKIRNTDLICKLSYLPSSLCFSTLVRKGQIISKYLFGVFNFFQKTNENSLHTSRNELFCSFLLKNSRLDNLLLKLTDL